jgi:3-oxoacyl-ACP reductase-like protein
MQSVTKTSESNRQQTPQATVYREIPAAPAAAAAAAAAAMVPASTDVQPGEIGAAAVKAAAMRQLDRYADDIEQYVNASNLRVLLNRIQGDLKKEDPAGSPKMRLRRE